MDQDKMVKAAISGVMYYIASNETRHRVEPSVQVTVPTPWTLNGRQTMIQMRTLVQRRVLKRY
ncbi:MAG: hypothetical protein JW969_13660 [Spirochaetales bacterium]|nr:hypothetical protein [Spirochaetales bacterium]